MTANIVAGQGSPALPCSPAPSGVNGLQGAVHGGRPAIFDQDASAVCLARGHADVRWRLTGPDAAWSFCSQACLAIWTRETFMEAGMR